MRGFRWLLAHAVPWERDLRRCNWQLRADPRNSDDDAVLIAPECRGAPFDPSWLSAYERRRTLVVGADDPVRRARLLAWGCGDVLRSDVSIDELSVRADRVRVLAQCLPRLLKFGRLSLDLMLRDARHGGRRLGLHPREFALLWHLIEAEGAPLCAAALTARVWQLSFRPETNSLAVHISRLRKKLALVGLAASLETVPEGYRLRQASVFAFGEIALDANSRLREDIGLLM